jgi:predicted Zn-dependent peptidase
MKSVISYLVFFLLGGLLLSSCGKKQAVFKVPVEYHKLDNGLKVVLSPDHTSPIVVVAVYYNIGFRIEPMDRTGFAHLFEHMMFQGSENLPKGELIKLINHNGGIVNGSTRFDFTNYFEIMPAHMLETVLWADADRMRALNVNQENLTNQQGVVINEVKVNVLNQPYGGFPWLDMPQYANENWFNAHNFYGDLEDIEAANLEDVADFYNTYYSPNNAALVVVGDFEPQEALAKVKKQFGNIKPSELPPQPDISEPKQEKWKFFTKPDPLANRPALAFAYHMPERNTPEYYAMGLLDQILLQGNDSRFYQALVQEKGLTGNVGGGVNMLGNMFNYNGPILWMGYLFYDNNVSHEEIMSTVDEEINKMVNQPLDQAAIDFAIIKMRSSLYNNLSDYYGFGRADLLASFALFDDDPARINLLEEQFRAVTPELLQKTAQEYLKKTSQTVLVIEPKAKS